MRPLRIWLVGLGMVGSWLASALDAQAARLASRYGRVMTVVGIANARDGFVYDANGLDLRSVLAAAASGRPITEQHGARVWPSTIAGLRATEADLLVEVTASPPPGGEPGFTHMREALGRGIAVVTSNKWPVALHGAELAALARNRGVAFRAESTVMSGTPLLSTLTEGLAERDPGADVEGDDSIAKVMILSGLVFGRQLGYEHVACRGITGITGQEARRAASEGGRLRHVATLAFSGPDGTGTVTARVRPEIVHASDLLARIDGVTNALVCQASPIGEVTIIGPGAGPQLAGQGVLSDIIAVARWQARNS